MTGGVRYHRFDRKVPGLDPKLAPIWSGDGMQPIADRKPEPGVRHEAFAAFVESAFEDQKFAPTRQIEFDPCSGRPALQPDIFYFIGK